MAWFLTTVLFLCITGTLTDAECHCSTTAACAVFPSTPCSQAGHSDRCQEGWFGSYCQRQNIASGRSATQSSTYSEDSYWTGYTRHSFDAKYGVDGISTTDMYSKPLTCTQTAVGDQNPTWTVHLNNSNTDRIQHIKLYLRQDLQDRNDGMKIFVGGQLCSQWSKNTHPPAVADVKCQEALAGNNLTIQTSVFLTLCEVQIFVCSDGWFGEDCDKRCHCSLNTEVCDKISGQCLSGCAPGYMGTDCQTACPDGFYGDCTFKCGNCLNAAPCNKTTGICSRGCAAGWLRDTCLQPCPNGYYGDCTSKCGNCFNAAICDKPTGVCPGACAAGWRTDRCLQPCQDGQYGINCTTQCGNCLDGHACNKATGMCPRGCAEGWMNDTCLRPCPNGYYGQNCGFQCGNCMDGDVCFKTNGTCPGGCAAGWINDRCKQACPDGYYGTDCTSRCGNCLGNDVCNKSTGTCSKGCAAGWMNNTCHNEDAATSGCSNQVEPVAVTLGTLLVLAVIALLIAIIYNRRLKNQLDTLLKKLEDHYVPLDERNKDPVVENIYEQINNTTPYVNTGGSSPSRI